MRHAFTHLKNTLYLLGSIIMLNSCSPEQKKEIPKLHTIEIKGMKFLPSELTVQKGDTLVWINKDIVTHDVTEELNKSWTSGPLPAGKSWSTVATKSDDYYCSIHVVMKGKIVAQ